MNDALTAEQEAAVSRWAIGFNAQRPDDGRLAASIVDAVGPMPVTGGRAHEVALEYFQSKMPAAITRYQTAVGLRDAPQDLFTGATYWHEVITWFRDNADSTEAPIQPGVPDFKDGDRVQLSSDLRIGGVSYSAGTTGFAAIRELGSSTAAQLAARRQCTIVLDGGGLVVLPRFLLEPTTKPGPTKL